MIRLEGLDEADLARVSDHLEATRLNILAGIVAGMAQGMQNLAAAVGAKLQGDPIAERTGNLLQAVLSSPRVIQTAQFIMGIVSTTSAKFRNLGLWLEFGTKFPTKGKGLSRYPQQFLHTFQPANPQSISRHGHGAFRIEPKPFFNDTFEEVEPDILGDIYDRIAEACDD